MSLKNTIYALFISVFMSSSLFAQVHLKGNLYSSLYVWENFNENQNTDFYQGIQFRAFHENYSNLQLNTYFRFARNGDPAEWNEKVYNAYLKWNSPEKQYELKLGRQFLYYGVINGTVDGMLFSTKLLKNLDVKLLAGAAAPIDRELVIQHWDNSNVLGFYSSYRFSNGLKLNASYYQKSNNLETVWQQFGTALSGKIICNLLFNARFDYNMKSSNYQGMRYRLTYFMDQWTFTGEFNSQRPRIYEDSYFRIFEFEGYNQFRSGVAYRFGDYQVGFRYLLTLYEDENNNQVHLTFGNQWGLLGFIYQNGYAGDNAGIFGELKYEFMENLSALVYSSYNKFQRQSVAIDEETVSFLGRINYQVLKDLDLQIEARENQNSYFKNDLRGLLRLNYKFKHVL
jgi:hypothetical protein